MEFFASVTGTTNSAVSWTVNNVANGNTTVGTISSGQYTAPSAVPSSSTVTVTATSKADSTKSASATVTVLPLGTGGISTSGLQTTATQAVIPYTATNSSQCQIAVSTNPSYGPVVNQLNTSLYGPAANQDGQTVVGQRYAVVGKRTFAKETTTSPVAIPAAACTRSATQVPGSTSEFPVSCAVANTLKQGDLVTISGMSNSSYNNTQTPVVSATPTSFTYYVTTGASDTAGGGTVQRQNAYSLALQANTTHYYQISGCVSSPITGQFTTMNVPNNNLWSDVYPTDAFGNWVIPTLPEFNDTTTTMTDPQTGVLIKRISIRPNTPGYPGGMGVSASIHRCMPVIDSNGFYTCMVDDGSEQLYKINPTSGEVRYIGLTQVPAGTDWAVTWLPNGLTAPFDDTDPNTFYVVAPSKGSPAKAIVLKVVYGGGDVANPNYQTPWPTPTVTDLTPPGTGSSLTDQLVAFTTGNVFPYNPAQYVAAACSIRSVAHGNLQIECNRWQQGSPTWNVVFNIATGKVVGAMAAWQNPTSRWCGAHGLVYNGSGWVQGGVGNLEGAGNNDCGTYDVLLHSAVTSSATSMTVDSHGTPSAPGVNGDPVGQTTPPDGSNFLDVARPGDLFQFADNSEIVQVTAVSGHTSWTVSRGCHFIGAGVLTCDGTKAATHALGAVIGAICSPSVSGHSTLYWAWLNDPHGTDSTNTNYVEDKAFSGGHGGGKEPYQVVEGPPGTGGSEWGVRFSTTPTWTSPFFQQVENFGITYRGFAGAGTSCTGNSCSHYPGSMDHDLTAKPWFMDSASFSGNTFPDTNTHVIGDIYLYHFVAGGSPHNFDPNQPYFALDGIHQLRDISGPGTLLPNTGSYEFCVVHTAGECWAGSTVDQVYADLPDSPAGSCGAREAGPSKTPDFCVDNFPVWDNGITQFGLTYLTSNIVGTDSNGAPIVAGGMVRKLVSSFVGPPRLNIVHDHVDPTGQWVFFETNLQQPNLLNTGATNGYDQLMMAQIPPEPLNDSVDRTTWESVPVQIGTATGATHARVLYGYEEYGQRSSFYCSPYASACISSNQSLALNSTVNLPIGAPQHVLYYMVEYLDASNTVVAADRTQAIAIP